MSDGSEAAGVVAEGWRAKRMGAAGAMATLEAARPGWPAPPRLPLLVRLVGANAIGATVTVCTPLLAEGTLSTGDWTLRMAALGLGLGVSTVLSGLALAPVARLRTALLRHARWHDGPQWDAARLADRDLEEIGDAVAALLAELVAERARLRQLARDTLRGADVERARVARGLYDSTAQTLAALSLEARAASELDDRKKIVARLELIRELATDALHEVRDLSQSLHPRVLDDLGLAAALRWLARCTGECEGADVALEVSGPAERVAAEPACTLFRVAQAALEDACARRGARTVRIRLTVGPARVELELDDDGTPPAGGGSSLHGVLAERCALGGGTLTQAGRDGGGVRVHAALPPGDSGGWEIP